MLDWTAGISLGGVGLLEYAGRNDHQRQGLAPPLPSSPLLCSVRHAAAATVNNMTNPRVTCDRDHAHHQRRRRPPPVQGRADARGIRPRAGCVAGAPCPPLTPCPLRSPRATIGSGGRGVGPDPSRPSRIARPGRSLHSGVAARGTRHSADPGAAQRVRARVASRQPGSVLHPSRVV
jgi:hypothetical protein